MAVPSTIALGDPNAPMPTPGPGQQPPAAATPPAAPPAQPSWLGKGQYQGTVPANFDAIGNGQAVDGAQGLNWYHTGALGGSAAYGGNDWIQSASAPGAPGAAAGPTGPTTAGQAITSPTTVGAQTPQGQPTTVASAFQQALVNRLNPGPVSADSPEISGAINANKASEQRSMEQNRGLLAERAASQGLDQNAFNTQLQGAAADSAGRQSQFAGNATMGLAQQRAQELTAALALGGNMLSQQDQLNMQKQLADLNAQISRESLGVQSTSIGNQFQLGQGQLNLGLLNALLGNQQFGQSLGAQIGQYNTSQNASQMSALIAALGG